LKTMNKYLQDIIFNIGSLTCIINRLANLSSRRHAEEVKKTVVKYADVINAMSYDIAEINKIITEDKNNEKIENKSQE
jgi:hypothetical protein